MIVKKLKGDTKMNDLKNTRKSNIKTAAMFLAFIAAIAFIMGYAVLTASATHIPCAPNNTAHLASVSANAKTAGADFQQGFFYDAGSGKVSLGIVKLDDKTFSCEVTKAGESGQCISYSFTAECDGETLIYKNGTQSAVKRDDKGNLIRKEPISSKQCGKFTMTDNGIQWNDTDGTSMLFVNDEKSNTAKPV